MRRVMTAEPSAAADPAKPLLYHAAPSHYSMIARLALVEAGCDFTGRIVDIHRARENQEPWYVRLNPEMTVPTLVLGEEVLPDSRLILRHLFPNAEEGAAGELLDRLYRFPVDVFTFTWLMRWNPIARFMIPRKLARIRAQMLQLADANPDLADLYRARAAVFDHRVTEFSQPPGPRWTPLRAQVRDLLAILEAALPGQAFLSGPTLGATDVVATVFLARLHFCRQGGMLSDFPAVAEYWRRMRGRDSFARADVWDRLHPRLLLKLVG